MCRSKKNNELCCNKRRFLCYFAFILLGNGALFQNFTARLCGACADIRSDTPYYVRVFGIFRGYGGQRMRVLLKAGKKNVYNTVFSSSDRIRAVGSCRFRVSELYYRHPSVCDLNNIMLFCDQELFEYFYYRRIFCYSVCTLEFILFFLEFLHNFIKLIIEKSGILMYNNTENKGWRS